MDEIDCMIKNYFHITDVVSAGVDDQMYIFLTDEEIASDVRQYVAEKTRINPVAFKMFVIDEIPKNESGKILFSALTQYYE